MVFFLVLKDPFLFREIAENRLVDYCFIESKIIGMKEKIYDKSFIKNDHHAFLWNSIGFNPQICESNQYL